MKITDVRNTSYALLFWSLGLFSAAHASDKNLAELAWKLSSVDSDLARQERAMGTHERMLAGDPNHSRSIDNSRFIDLVLKEAALDPLKYEGIVKMLVDQRRITPSAKLLAARYTLGRASYLRKAYTEALEHYFLFLKLADARDPQWSPQVETVVTQILALPQSEVLKVRIDHLLGNIRGFALNEELSTDLIVMCVRAALLAQQWDLVEAWTTIVRRANIRTETMDLYRAIALYHRGSVNEARELFSKLESSSEKDTVNSAHVYLARIADADGFPHVALKHYAEVSQEYPDYTEVARTYADLLAKHEKFDKARQIIETQKGEESFDLVFQAWLGIKTQDYTYAREALENLRSKIEREYQLAQSAPAGELQPNLDFLAARRNPLAAHINGLFLASKRAQASLAKLGAAHHVWLQRHSETPWAKIAPYRHATEAFLKEIGKRHIAMGQTLVAIIRQKKDSGSIGDASLAKFAAERTKTLEAKEGGSPVDPDLISIQGASAHLNSLRERQVILRSASAPNSPLIVEAQKLETKARLLALEYAYLEPLAGLPYIRSKIAILQQVLQKQEVATPGSSPFVNRFRAVASRWIRVATDLQQNIDLSENIRKELWTEFQKQNQQDARFQKEQAQNLVKIQKKVDRLLKEQLVIYRNQIEGQYQEALANLKFWEAKVAERQFNSIEEGIEATVERLRDAQTKLVGIRLR